MVSSKSNSNAFNLQKTAATTTTIFHINLIGFLNISVDGNMPYDLCDDEETLDCIEAEMSRRGITQELIDETRASTENQMLNDLQVLVENGGDIDVLDKQGATPVSCCSMNTVHVQFHSKIMRLPKIH